MRLAKVGCAQKAWQPEPGFLAAGSAGQEASGLHQALPEPRSSVLKKREKATVAQGRCHVGLCGQNSVRVRKARSCGMGAGCEAWVSSRLAVSSQRWSPRALICDTFISGPSQDASPLPPAVSSGAPGFPPWALSIHRVAPHNVLLGLSCPGKLHVHVTGGRGTLFHPRRSSFGQHPV